MADVTGGTATGCQQSVFEDDMCCIQRICEAPATWRHVETGMTLCDKHEVNAQRWASGGLWRVGTVDVSYPSGWEREDAGAAASNDALERVVDADVTDPARVEHGGLVIERGGSGIVIEREPINGL